MDYYILPMYRFTHTLKLQAYHLEHERLYRVISLPRMEGGPVGLFYTEESTLTCTLDRVLLRPCAPFVDKHGHDLYHGDVIRLFDWSALHLLAWIDNGFYACFLDHEDVSPSQVPYDYDGVARSTEYVGNVFEHPQYRIGLGEGLMP